jgi:hypothetical protein
MAPAVRTAQKLQLTAVLFVATGCGDVPLPAEKQPAKTAVVKSAPAAPKVVKRPPPERRNAPGTRTPVSETRSAASSSVESQAVKKIGTVIRQTVELGPTLVIWLFDRTPSAQDMVGEVSGAAARWYGSPEAAELLAGDSEQLLTAVLTFDENSSFVLDPPAQDATQIKEALAEIKFSTAAREMPLTALKQALGKYLPLRIERDHQFIVVLVTDEAGHDPQVCDELIETTRRHAIPVYAIGLPAPWGQTNPFAPDPKAVEAAGNDSNPMFGPESAQSERVDIENWTARYATRENTEFIDSGFGPFALERLCRASRGQFLALRPDSQLDYRSASDRLWPSGGELRFDEQVAVRYAPDYVSAAQYQQLVAENKARSVLCEAARLPKVAVEGTPGSRFPKAAEAKMANQLSAAQKFAASNSPRVDRLYDVLAPGESDRPKLTGLRWQAEFDLAYGRVLANKSRLDGYNSMLAALKRGKTFQNATSQEWVLEPADHFETESTIKRLADKARQYLERVMAEHQGTPWATIAEEELKLPLGWRWEER